MESPYERLAKGLKLTLQHGLLNCGYTWLDGVGIAPAALCEGIFYSHRLQSFSHMRYILRRRGDTDENFVTHESGEERVMV
jgi:hypothetical protein